jgi:hypothetical protein
MAASKRAQRRTTMIALLGAVLVLMAHGTSAASARALLQDPVVPELATAPGEGVDTTATLIETDSGDIALVGFSEGCDLSVDDAWTTPECSQESRSSSATEIPLGEWPLTGLPPTLPQLPYDTAPRSAFLWMNPWQQRNYKASPAAYTLTA